MTGDLYKIIIIQSLQPDEPQTGRSVYDDIINVRLKYDSARCAIKGAEFFNVNTLDHFQEVINAIFYNAKHLPGGLLIHLEVHGNSEGIVLSDGTFISWEEVANKFRGINIQLKNSLYLSLATCYGRNLFKGVISTLKSPFSGYISASQRIGSEEILVNFEDLFAHLMVSGNLIHSYLEANRVIQSKFYYKDIWTIFEEIMEEAFRTISNPEFTKEIIAGNPILQNYEMLGLIDPVIEQRVKRQVFRDLFLKYLKPFEFNENEIQ